MARIRCKDTKPEIAVRAAVCATGARFRKNVADLPGKPDLANKSRRWAIFVHGCFWHGHGCSRSSTPKTNAAYWTPKLQRNRERDVKHIAALAGMGFRTLVIWECELASAEALAETIESFFAQAVETTG